MSPTNRQPGCGRVSRRTFLADVGMGLTGIALGSLLQQDGIARATEAAKASEAAKALEGVRAN